MEKLTQKELVLSWVKEHGYIIPARMAGRIYRDHMFGSETSRQCRYLRSNETLDSKQDPDSPKFTRFFLPKSEQTSLFN